MDVLSPADRRKTMAAVKSTNTKPEIAVRRLLFACGYRFRLHRKDLPGKPDIVLPKHKTVVLVHGCFWHQHANCKRASRPVSRREYWDQKLDRNKARDKAQMDELRALGWQVVVVWECEVRDLCKLKAKLVSAIECSLEK